LTYSVSEKQTTFADATVADDQHFEEVVTKMTVRLEGRDQMGGESADILFLIGSHHFD